MINAIIIFIILGFLYWRIRNLYYNSIALEFQHKLYKLRDKSRMYAIEKKIKQHDFFFDYIDSSICITIKELPYFNIFGILYLYSQHKNEDKAIQFKKLMNHALENKYAKELYDEYGSIISQYMSKRHYLITLAIRILARIFRSLFSLKRTASDAREAIKLVTVYPETSSAYTLI